MNLLEFADKMDKRADSLAKVASDAAKEFTLRLTHNLIWATPVDVTTALSNWQVTLDSPARDFIEAHTPGFNGITTSASAAEANRLALLAVSNARPGQTYWLSNNAPYIIDLNNGSSRQAPAMFVQQTIQRTRAELPEIIKKVMNDNRFY